MLGVNVFCAAMVRYPWKGYQTGFVITHLGIITLLMGSIIGLLFGVEGSITLIEQGQPRSFIAQDFEVLTVTSRESGKSINAPLELEGRKPDANGKTLKTGAVGLVTKLKAHYANTKEELSVAEGGKEYNPAVQFRFSSQLPGMEKSGMNISEWLIEGDAQRSSLSVGPALFKIQTVSSPEVLAEKLHPSTNSVAGGKGVLRIKIDQSEYEVPVAEHLEKPFQTPDGKAKVILTQYFPDLRIENKQPVSVSDDPNNPAVFFEVQMSQGSYKGFAFADYPEMNIVRPPEGQPAAVTASYSFSRAGLTASSAGAGAGPMAGLLNTITILVGPDQKLYYTSSSARSGFHSGEISLNQGIQIAPNSPMKPELKVEKFVTKPLVTSKYIPAPTNAMSQFVFPAVELSVSKNGQNKDLLLRWGEPAEVDLGGSHYELTYGWSMVPVDFSIQLERFNVPKYEGTDMDAGYESYVKIKNAKTGDEFSQKIWMNHPLTYKGYRISQASFDRPQDGMGYRSTLQILRDPGWILKLAGSFCIIGGIITMFYIKPYFKGLTQERARRAAAASPVAKKNSPIPAPPIAARRA